MTEESLQIEFLKELIINSPFQAKMNVNGFYSENISNESFYKLFSEKQVFARDKISNYIISLSSVYKNILLDILILEKEKLIYDLIHFSIEINNKLIFISYDNMEMLQINRNEFETSFIDLIDEKYISLEILILDEITDDGFFS